MSATVTTGLPLSRFKVLDLTRVRVGEVAAPVDPGSAPPTPPPFVGGRRWDILDVRRRSEHEGTEKRARRVGTVPGAVHVFWRDHLDIRINHRFSH